jgi:transcription elongation GreA/GreB family factor
VRKEVGQAREHASDLAAKTLAHIETQIQQLRSDLDRVQVLDLRWAIAGLGITAVGTVLSYGT